MPTAACAERRSCWGEIEASFSLTSKRTAGCFGGIRLICFRRGRRPLPRSRFIPSPPSLSLSRSRRPLLPHGRVLGARRAPAGGQRTCCGAAVAAARAAEPHLDGKDPAGRRGHAQTLRHRQGTWAPRWLRGFWEQSRRLVSPLRSGLKKLLKGSCVLKPNRLPLDCVGVKCGTEGPGLLVASYAPNLSHPANYWRSLCWFPLCIYAADIWNQPLLTLYFTSNFTLIFRPWISADTIST